MADQLLGAINQLVRGRLAHTMLRRELTAPVEMQPPGTDLFAFVESTIITTIYPPLFKGFWLHAYFCIALLSCIILAFLYGIYIKARTGTLKWILQDGAATRLYLPTIVGTAFCSRISV